MQLKLGNIRVIHVTNIPAYFDAIEIIDITCWRKILLLYYKLCSLKYVCLIIFSSFTVISFVSTFSEYNIIAKLSYVNKNQVRLTLVLTKKCRHAHNWFKRFTSIWRNYRYFLMLVTALLRFCCTGKWLSLTWKDFDTGSFHLLDWVSVDAEHKRIT